jgi:hypothetical protein
MTDRLSRFTPNAPSLGRDAILFAAGRRSARASSTWKAAVALLAASQTITLIALWPTRPTTVVPVVSPPALTPVSEPMISPPSPPTNVWTVAAGPDLLDAPTPRTTVQFVPSDPPLTVRSGLPFE